MRTIGKRSHVRASEDRAQQESGVSIEDRERWNGVGGVVHGGDGLDGLGLDCSSAPVKRTVGKTWGALIHQRNNTAFRRRDDSFRFRARHMTSRGHLSDLATRMTHLTFGDAYASLRPVSLTGTRVSLHPNEDLRRYQGYCYQQFAGFFDRITKLV